MLVGLACSGNWELQSGLHTLTIQVTFTCVPPLPECSVEEQKIRLSMEECSAEQDSWIFFYIWFSDLKVKLDTKYLLASLNLGKLALQPFSFLMVP